MLKEGKEVQCIEVNALLSFDSTEQMRFKRVPAGIYDYVFFTHTQQH